MDEFEQFKNKVYQKYACKFCKKVSMFGKCDSKEKLDKHVSETLDFDAKCEDFEVDMMEILQAVAESNH